MKKGGYQIIDFKGKNFTLNSSVLIDDIYDTIDQSKKVCLFSGVNGHRDFFLNLEKDEDGNFVGYFDKYKIIIDEDNYVYVANETPNFIVEDFLNDPFTVSTAKTVEGIYDRIEGTGKAVLIKGVTVGDTDFREFVANVTLSSTDFVIEFGDYIMTITDEDKVTITEKQS